MSKVEDNKQNGDKILRAGDIMPPYNVRSAQTTSAELSGARKTSTSSVESRERDIPRFNLAEEIMAEQRKVTSAKRKALGLRGTTPGQQEKTIESIRHAVILPTPLFLKQQQIIAEIVAKDIAKLCRDFVSDQRRNLEAWMEI
jgi:hypothetical protein